VDGVLGYAPYHGQSPLGIGNPGCCHRKHLGAVRCLRRHGAREGRCAWAAQRGRQRRGGASV